MHEIARTDILVVGGGPAGIAGAVSAAEHGRRVLLLDANPQLGGQIWRGANSDRIAAAWINRFHASGARHLSGCEVIGCEDQRTLRIATFDGQSRIIEYEKLILATGARELFLPIPGWTLPGFFGAGGLQALAKTGLAVDGKRIVVAGSGPLLFAVAATLQQMGAEIVLIAEQSEWKHVGRFAGYLLLHQFKKLRQAVRLRQSLKSTAYYTGCWLQSIQGSDKVEVANVTNGRKQWSVHCDYVACGFGLVPNLELPRYLGCNTSDGSVAVDPYQQSSVPGVYCAGELTGVAGVDAALVEGEIAGLAAVGKHDQAGLRFRARRRLQRFAERIKQAFALRDELRRLADRATIVCRCEDVPFHRLREFGNWREAKLQTRVGMGPCQGRVCGAACEFLFNWHVESQRPPVFPCLIGQWSDSKLQADQATN